uniref:Minor capsid protein n=1 Tax=Gokushovirinae environmental samples TaxID=1478972 RepID=A0A2R3UAS9_9VIRU|nr:minor capsid protein [Gokushovirinae environmental samples]
MSEVRGMVSSRTRGYRSRVETPGPSLTVQSSAEEADINTIVKRFGVTGQAPQNVRVPLEGDFTEAMDFSSAMRALRLSQESFAAMPADVRSRFHNDPAEFYEFSTSRDEKGDLVNLEEMRKFGLAVPAKAPDPEPEPVLVRMAEPVPPLPPGVPPVVAPAPARR